MRGGYHRWGSDHYICSKTNAFRRQGHKIRALAVIVPGANLLFRIGVPSCASAKADPFITQAVVSADAGSLRAGACMSAVGTKLVSTWPACGEGGVLAALARAEDWQTKMLCQGKPEGTRVEVGVGRRSVPTHKDFDLPSPTDVRLSSDR